MKPLFVISCPIDTMSGYGARSRDIVKSLIKLEKYDIKVIPQRWGNTALGFLKEDNPEHKQILDCILREPQLPRQPDIWMQISIPNEFQPVGKVNIGVTAGIETTICDPSWIEGLNRMNLNLVSSNHAKRVFEETKYEARNQQTNQIEKIIELTSPIKVLFEGVDTNIYKKIEKIPSKNDCLKDIDEDFCFLFTGHWLQGDLGEDRKNVGMLIRMFLETFKGKKTKPALILKTQGATASIIDRNDIINKINIIQNSVNHNDLPNVYLIHGSFDDEEMNLLYNNPKIKVHISLTKGEGFGRPLLEASLSGKPVMASNWSGHIDFLKPETSILLPGVITQIHPSAVVNNMLIPESGWFTVDYKQVSDNLKEIYKNYNKFLEKAKRQAYHSKSEFNLEKMGILLDSIIDPLVPKFVPLKLPNISKIQIPKKQNND